MQYYFLIFVLMVFCNCAKWNKEWDEEDAEEYKLLTSCCLQDEAILIATIKRMLSENNFIIEKIENGHIVTKWKNTSLPNTRLASGTRERSRIDLFILGSDCKRIIVNVEVNEFKEKRSNREERHWVYSLNESLAKNITKSIYREFLVNLEAQPRPKIEDRPTGNAIGMAPPNEKPKVDL